MGITMRSIVFLVICSSSLASAGEPNAKGSLEEVWKSAKFRTQKEVLGGAPECTFRALVTGANPASQKAVESSFSEQAIVKRMYSLGEKQGFKFLPEPPNGAPVFPPHLDVVYEILVDEAGEITAVATFEFHEKVLVPRSPPVISWAITWRSRKKIVAKNLDDLVQQTIGHIQLTAASGRELEDAFKPK